MCDDQVFRAISREETEVKKMELPAALGLLPESRRGEGASGAPTDFDDCIHQLNRSTSVPEGIRAVLPIGEGCIVTGGCDQYIRVWDGVEPKHSFPMCGPTPQNPYSASQARPSRVQCIADEGEDVCREQWARMIFSTVGILNEACPSSTNAVCHHTFNDRRRAL